MNISIEPGKYVIAVSGGVDSVCLLNMLSKMSSVELIVAHFDHGIRSESHDDARFVEELARSYGLPFELGRKSLGPNASEAVARNARYEFFETVRKKTHTSAIVTAHHKDDVLETAIINLLRGTNRKGLTAILDNPYVVRPLADVPKEDLYKYAKTNGLSWVEDKTNLEEKYLRNKVRKQLTTTSGADKAKLYDLIRSTKNINSIIDGLIDDLFKSICDDNITLQKKNLIELPHNVSKEVVAHWFRMHNIQLSSKMLEKAVATLKTGKTNTLFDIDKAHVLRVGKTDVSIVSRS